MTNMKYNSTKKHNIRNDIILIVALLLVAVIGALYLFVFRSSGNTVKVTVDGKTYGVFSLNENITEDIHTGKDNLNRLIIRDGESIVCLPNRVVVTVTTNDADSPDIVI